jgi:hypothetical protein
MYCVNDLLRTNALQGHWMSSPRHGDDPELYVPAHVEGPKAACNCCSCKKRLPAFAPASANVLIIASRLSLALASESTQIGSSFCSVSTVHPSKYVVRGMEALIASLISHTVSGFSGSLQACCSSWSCGECVDGYLSQHRPLPVHHMRGPSHFNC